MPESGVQLAGEHPEQGRLADAVGADHRDPVTGRDGEIDVVQHDEGAVGDAHAPRGEQRHLATIDGEAAA